MGKEEKDWIQIEGQRASTRWYSFEGWKRIRGRVYQVKSVEFLHLYSGEKSSSCWCFSSFDRRKDNILCHLSGAMVMRLGKRRGSQTQTWRRCNGKAGGLQQGRGRSMHLFWNAQRIFSEENANRLRHLPLAVGMALAAKNKRKKLWLAAFLEKGACGRRRVFHDRWNLAFMAVPALLFCEKQPLCRVLLSNYPFHAATGRRKGLHMELGLPAVDDGSFWQWWKLLKKQ